MTETPWSVAADLVGDIVRLDAMLSLDPGPMREFRPFLTIDLDEAHASQLLAQLGAALHGLRREREAESIKAGTHPRWLGYDRSATDA